MLIYGRDNDGETVWEAAGHEAGTPVDALLAYITEEAADDAEAFQMVMAIPVTAIMEEADPHLQQLLAEVA